MNFYLIFAFSRKARLKLALILTILNLTQVIFGIVLTGWSIYVCLSVTKNLYSEKAEITFVFTVIGMYGTHVIFQFLVGIKICENCFLKAHKRSTKKKLYFWLATCMNTILNINILAMIILKVSKHIVRSIRHSMEKGMRIYMKDRIWKRTIDRWQFNLQCCGINSFEDWYEISWLNKYLINVEDPLVQSFLLNKGQLHLPVVPWSCCNVKFPMQCFHDPIQQIEFAHLWKEQPDFIQGSINQQGCLHILKKPIEDSLIGFIFVAVLLLINMMFIFIISRLLYTSCRSAVVLRDPYGKAPGWVFGRDCCAPRKGRTVSEIMLDLGYFPNETTTYGQSSTKSESLEKAKSKKFESTLESIESPEIQVIKDVSPRLSENDPVSSGEEDALLLK